MTPNITDTTAGTTAGITPAHILTFWFEEITPAQWWAKSDAFDAMVTQRFGAVHRAAGLCELSAWRATPEGRLAEILVLDQFSRNIHRGSPLSFAHDPLALGLAQTAVAVGADQALPAAQRVFVYMPYMHSESPLVHVDALALFTELGAQRQIDFELRHKAIVDRFGRYPHRNELLGRVSTDDELAFLQTPGSSF
jgi:uncharacterized protein (DUF924 family)